MMGQLKLFATGVSWRRWIVVVTYRCPDEAGMALDPRLVRIAEEADGAQGGGGNELDGEDAVDLADELVADVDGGFSDRASKLFCWK